MTFSHRFRQVHLDFHTGPDCQEVAMEFNPEKFVKTLQMGHVDTVNIFAKCHHGFSYYPTKIGTMHPNLKINLLGEQIKTLHQANIRCPIYVSLKWDDLSGIQHPEWLVVNKDGKVNMRPPVTGQWGWSSMDVSSPYGETFLAQVEELCDLFGDEVDGFWFDICFPMPNYSSWGQAQMRKAGINLEDDLAVYRYARNQDLAFFKRLTGLVKHKAPQATYYLNGTTTMDMGEVAPYVTHFEVESLPTSGGAWGYMHYPILARQARTYGKEMIGMTGRFHKSWADFGGLKTQDQLDYECGTILAAGGRICVGDQLHPRGVLDPAVYRLIGKSFEWVEKLEPWLSDSQPVVDVAILALGMPVDSPAGVGAYSPDVEGAAQMLLECGIQFDIVDDFADLLKYTAVILPDQSVLDEQWKGKLTAYLDKGGRMILSGCAGLDPLEGKFQLPQIPVEMIGPAPTQPSYLRPDSLLTGESELAADYDYVFYESAWVVRAVEGAECHGDIKRALFTRTWEHFTSHQHAPAGETLAAPVMVLKRNVMYFAVPLFSAYRTHDYWAYRAMFQNAVRSFLPPAQLIPGGPGWVEFTVHTQPQKKGRTGRQVVHVVAYHPRRSLQGIQHVDQSWQTSGLSFQLRISGQSPSRVYLAPEEKDLPFKIEDGYVKVELPPIGSHVVVVVE